MFNKSASNCIDLGVKVGEVTVIRRVVDSGKKVDEAQCSIKEVRLIQSNGRRKGRLRRLL